jgi:hypothetical protein
VTRRIAERQPADHCPTETTDNPSDLCPRRGDRRPDALAARAVEVLEQGDLEWKPGAGIADRLAESLRRPAVQLRVELVPLGDVGNHAVGQFGEALRIWSDVATLVEGPSLPTERAPHEQHRFVEAFGHADEREVPLEVRLGARKGFRRCGSATIEPTEHPGLQVVHDVSETVRSDELIERGAVQQAPFATLRMTGCVRVVRQHPLHRFTHHGDEPGVGTDAGHL